MAERDSGLTRAELNALLQKHFTESLQADEEQVLAARPGKPVYALEQEENEHPADVDESVLAYLLDEAREALRLNSYKTVEARVDALLDSEGCRKPVGGDALRYLSQGLLRADIELLKLAIAKRSGDFTQQPLDPLFNQHELTRGEVNEEPLPSGPLLSSLIDQHLNWLDEQGEITKQNLGQRRGTLRFLLEYFGDVPLDSIERHNLVEYRERLSSLPAKHGQLKDWKGLSLDLKFSKVDEEGLEDGTPLLADKTIKRQFSEISQLYQWAIDRNLIKQSNPVRDFKWRKSARASEQGTHFYPEELLTLFKQPIWRGCLASQRNKAGDKIIKDSRYYIPLIGLYSGMRLGEIAQLYLDDLKQSPEGIWYFDINEERDKRVKTGKPRLVPVHSELIRLGLLEYYEAMKATGAERLWPEVKPSSLDGNYGAYPSKQFRETVRVAGLSRQFLRFHSFRRTVATALHNAGVAEELASAILGHEYQSMSYSRYSSGMYNIVLLRDALEKIEFDTGL